MNEFREDGKSMKKDVAVVMSMEVSMRRASRYPDQINEQGKLT